MSEEAHPDVPVKAALPRRRARTEPDPAEEPVSDVQDATLALPHVRLSDLIERNHDAELVIWSALSAAGFTQDGDTFRNSLARLQRYLGNRPIGHPGRHELTWLALRTQAFTTD